LQQKRYLAVIPMASLASPGSDRSALSAFLRHVPSLVLVALIVGLFASVGGGLTFHREDATATPGAAPGVVDRGAASAAEALTAPESDPTVAVSLTAEDAQARNAALLAVGGPNPAAAAFHLPADEIARMRSIDCLTAAIYYEAGLEPEQGQRAVAQVVLNRVRHPAYPNTVCGVVFQGSERTSGCQFSFTCSGMLRRTPNPAIWARARRYAADALAGYVERSVGLATHYHADYVFPNWAPTLTKVTTIGRHIFYRWDGSWGPRGPLNARYAGAEPDIRWRGGFGQPERTLAVAIPPINTNSLTVPPETGQGQAPLSVDSFGRAVLRRYEPVDASNAGQIIESRLPAQTSSGSSRWALTGQPAQGTAEQRPLGREAPVLLEGVRRRPAGEAPAPAAPANASQSR
jgi:spore germination cell wall hydrolase CwlJ-like protein